MLMKRPCLTGCFCLMGCKIKRQGQLHRPCDRTDQVIRGLSDGGAGEVYCTRYGLIAAARPYE